MRFLRINTSDHQEECGSLHKQIKKMFFGGTMPICFNIPQLVTTVELVPEERLFCHAIQLFHSCTRSRAHQLA